MGPKDYIGGLRLWVGVPHSMSLTTEFVYNPIPMRRLTLCKLLSGFDIRLKINPFLKKSDLRELAATCIYLMDQVELMLQMHWVECPRLTNYTLGSLEHRYVMSSWDELTSLGTILPLSDELHRKLLKSPSHRRKLQVVMSHSQVWVNNDAMGLVFRWFATVFMGKCRRDGDVFHDITNVVEAYNRNRRAVGRFVAQGGVSHTSLPSCLESSEHDEAELTEIQLENSEWWYRMVMRYLCGCIRELRRSYTIDQSLTIGGFAVVTLEGGRLARMECFEDMLHAMTLYGIADRLAVEAVTNAFI